MSSFTKYVPAAGNLYLPCNWTLHRFVQVVSGLRTFLGLFERDWLVIRHLNLDRGKIMLEGLLTTLCGDLIKCREFSWASDVTLFGRTSMMTVLLGDNMDACIKCTGCPSDRDVMGSAPSRFLLCRSTLASIMTSVMLFIIEILNVSVLIYWAQHINSYCFKWRLLLNRVPSNRLVRPQTCVRCPQTCVRSE